MNYFILQYSKVIENLILSHFWGGGGGWELIGLVISLGKTVRLITLT